MVIVEETHRIQLDAMQTPFETLVDKLLNFLEYVVESERDWNKAYKWFF